MAASKVRPFVAAAVTAILVGMLTPLGERIANFVLPDVTESSPASTPSPSACPKQLQISEPRDNFEAKGSDGVVVKGSACGLDGKTAWLFDFDSSENSYWLIGDGGPVTSQDGPWQAHDKPMGDVGDNRKPYEIILVLANADCDKAIRAALDADGHLTTAMPPSCAIADQVTTLITG